MKDELVARHRLASQPVPAPDLVERGALILAKVFDDQEIADGRTGGAVNAYRAGVGMTIEFWDTMARAIIPIIQADERKEYDRAMLQWLDEAWPNGTGSDFNQGVVRGFEIIKAQIEHGHIPAFRERNRQSSPFEGTTFETRDERTEREAEQLYRESTANDPVIHCNRFPVWDALSEEQKQAWRSKALLERPRHD